MAVVHLGDIYPVHALSGVYPDHWHNGLFQHKFPEKNVGTGWFLGLHFPDDYFQGQIDYHSLIFLPATIMVAHYYHLFKRSAWNEIALLLFLLLILANNYLELFRA
jgi:hypothetical protein